MKSVRARASVRCNHTLGKVKDDAALLRKLAAYVENPIGPTGTPNEMKCVG